MRAMKTPTLAPGEKMLFASGIHWKDYVIPLTVIFLAALLSMTSIASRRPLTQGLLDALGSPQFFADAHSAALLTAVERLTLLVLAIHAIRKAVTLAFTGYFVTDRRVIRMTGWLNTLTTEIRIERCKVMDVKQNIIEKIFATGDVLITTAETSLLLEDVPQVRTFARTINERVDAISSETYEIREL